MAQAFVFTGAQIDVIRGFVIRWLLCATIVFSTFNPTGFSYYHWVTAPGGDLISLKVLVGIVLLIADVALLRIAFVSIGYQGIAATLAIIAVVLLSAGALGILKRSHVTWSWYWTLFILVTVLAVGITWSHAQQRISGERDVLHFPP